MIEGKFSRGSTPTHSFTLPFNMSMVEEIRISYSQGNKKILTKTLRDADVSENGIFITLSQEETLKFKAGENAEIQLKIKTTSEKVINSNIIYMLVEETLDEEVI